MDWVNARQKLDEEVSIGKGILPSMRTYSSDDHVVEFSLLIDSKALLTLLGSEMDYAEDKLSAGFVFHNPNVKETCGCGLSFIV